MKRIRKGESGNALSALPALRVLHVEDNPDDAELIATLLGRSKEAAFQIEHVTTLREALATSTSFSVVLLDLDLPDSRGLDTLHRFRKVHPWVPLVVVTGHLEKDMALAALGAGAHDYLVKDDAVLGRLEQRIMHALERSRIQATMDVSGTRGGGLHMKVQRRPGRTAWKTPAELAKSHSLVYVAFTTKYVDAIEQLRKAGIRPGAMHVIEAVGDGDPAQRGLGYTRMAGSPDLEDLAVAIEDGCRLQSPDCIVVVDSLEALVERHGERLARDFLVVASNRLRSLGVPGWVLAHDSALAQSIQDMAGGVLGADQ